MSGELIFALVVFALTYVMMFVFSKYRPWIALTSALVFIIFGIFSDKYEVKDLFFNIDFNVILMIAGTMVTVSLMIESKMPSLMADILIEKVPNVLWLTFILSIFAGIVSAFIDNVATVLMIAPIALELAKKLKINPVGMIIAIAVSSNLQGAATLVGDTTSILLAGYAKMNFLDFFFYEGKPSMFFATELGALCSALLILIIFRKQKDKILPTERTRVEDYVPSILLLLTVITLIIFSFIPLDFSLINGVICVSYAIIGLVYIFIRTYLKSKNAPIEDSTQDEDASKNEESKPTQSSSKKAFSQAFKAIKEVDYQTILLLVGLFMVIGGIKALGLIDQIAHLFKSVGGDNVFLIYTMIVWLSVLFSAFIDNIPYVATMLPVCTSIGLSIGLTNPVVLYFGLLCGATLGGNLTPIGASANITAIGLLRKEGYEVKNKDFLKIGLPFTFAAIIPAYIFIWLIFGM